MTSARRIVLAGGRGFLGEWLASHHAALGNEVTVLTRAPRSAPPPGVRDVLWDGVEPGSWTTCMDAADLLVNLTGRSVDCRYTEANRKEIVESRVRSVEALARGCAQIAQPPRVWIQAGSLAIYGNAGDRVCDEAASHGTGFSVDVCQRWEHAFEQASVRGVRQVLLRIGLVIGPGGGALAPLAGLARAFLGGTVGSGEQYMSWLDARDFVRLVEWCAKEDSACGTYNACAPGPVRNSEFMRALRHALGRPWAPPTPTFAVHLGARFVLRTEAELALSGRRGVPARLLDEGFAFEHESLASVLEHGLSS